MVTKNRTGTVKPEKNPADMGKPRALVKHWFLGLKDGNSLAHFGQVVEHLEGGHYLLQCYECITGQPYEKMVVHLSAMGKWCFFDDKEDWADAYNGLPCNRQEF